MEVKWTSGPWSSELMFTTDDDDPEEIRSQIMIVANGVMIAQTWDKEADLICSAPELYAALERLLKANEREGKFAGDLLRADAWSSVVDQSLAALAKARGEK